MKRKPLNTSGNPTTVIRAFAPETEFTLTLDGWILLEALESPYAHGGRISMRDSIILLLALTEVDALIAAKRKGPAAIDALIATLTAGKRPAEMIALRPKLEAAITAALEPISSNVTTPEKKSSPASGGG